MLFLEIRKWELRIGQVSLKETESFSLIIDLVSYLYSPHMFFRTCHFIILSSYTPQVLLDRGGWVEEEEGSKGEGGRGKGG